MLRLLLFAVAVRIGCAAENPSEILSRVTQNVAAQLAKSANYTCVETVDRTYFLNKRPMRTGCEYPMGAADRKEWMHDRLRLDIAVSDGLEIYSWHAANRFSSGSVSEIVRHGPISSGNFVGYLHNIFLDSGGRFSYAGKFTQDGAQVYRFKYTVPLAASHYHIQSGLAEPIIPFHGEFSASASDYQLTSLQVIADSTSKVSHLCSVDTDLSYQMVSISGKPSLIPASFLLRIDTDSHLSTLSRSEYTQCREFRGESTLLFHTDATAAPTSAADPPPAAEWLPAGLTLNIGLRSFIDNRTSFTGDSVEGVLLDAVQIPHTKTMIPEGAILHGVILQLERRFEPWQHYLVTIQFERLSYGGHSFRLRALPQTPKKSYGELDEIYGQMLPPDVASYAQRGVFAVASSHLHLGNRFTGIWKTVEPSERR